MNDAPHLDTINPALTHQAIPHWIRDLFAAVDAKDIDRFMAHMSPTIGFGFDGHILAEGLEPVRRFVEDYLANFARLEHQIEAFVAGDDPTAGPTTAVRGRVTYWTQDSRSAEVGWAVFLTHRDGKIDRYRIYLDSSAVQALFAASPDQAG